MRLYHATPKKNLPAIYQHGLNPNLARGKRKVVWYHTKQKQEWAIKHTAKNHDCTRSEIAIICVDIPRKDLTRRWRGIWTTSRKAYIQEVYDVR